MITLDEGTQDYIKEFKVKEKPVYSFVKRAFDFGASLVGLVCLSPVLLVTGVAIKLESEGPIIFSQDRVGLNGKKFKMYKLRSMVSNAEELKEKLLEQNEMSGPMFKMKDDPRITKVGKFIRKTSIDELPQLINVLKGDMSLIGPRPPLVYHPWTYNEYTEEQKRMFDARPGITGWAQINGRKTVEWNKRIELNVWYVDHISFLLDIKIFFKTILKIFTNENNLNEAKTIEVKPFTKEEERVTK